MSSLLDVAHTGKSNPGVLLREEELFLEIPWSVEVNINVTFFI